MTDTQIEKLLKKNHTKDITCLLLTNPVSEWWDIIDFYKLSNKKSTLNPNSSEKKQLLDIFISYLNRKEFSLNKILYHNSLCWKNWEKYYDTRIFLDLFTVKEINDTTERFIGLDDINFNEKMLSQSFNKGIYIKIIQDICDNSTKCIEIKKYFDKILGTETSKKKIDLFSILYYFNIDNKNKNIFDTVIFTDETYDIIKRNQNKIMQRAWCANSIRHIAINNKIFIIESLKHNIDIFRYILPFNFSEDDDPLNSMKNLMGIAKEYFNDEKEYNEYIEKYLFNKISFSDFIVYAEDSLFRDNLQYMNSEKQEKIREYFKLTDSLNDDCENSDAFIYAAELKDREFYNLITNKTRNLSNMIIKKLTEIRKDLRKSGKIFVNSGYTDLLLRDHPEIYYQIVGDIISQKVLKSDPLLKILKESGMIKGISLNIIPNSDVSEDTINLFLQLSNKIQ